MSRPLLGGLRSRTCGYDTRLHYCARSCGSRTRGWSWLESQRRPHYSPQERMAILELRAARGWPIAQTAGAFFVTTVTTSEWLRRIDEQRPHAIAPRAPACTWSRPPSIACSSRRSSLGQRVKQPATATSSTQVLQHVIAKCGRPSLLKQLSPLRSEKFPRIEQVPASMAA